MEKLINYIHTVEHALNHLNVPVYPKTLYQPITYTLGLGGKRIRPALLLLANDLFSGRQENALSAALAVEVFHNFTLIHDDVMDDAPLRRGKETVYKKWGINTAILSGDVMFVKSVDLLAKSPEDKLPELIHLFTKTAFEVCEGQQYDMDFEQKTDVSIDDYLKMIELKTAVLLAASLQLGAIIGGAGKEDQQHIYEFGKNLGLAFQLMDDVLDLYGNPEKFGKRVGGDIIANKKTYLLLKAKELATGELKKELEFCLTSKALKDDQKIEKVKSIFNRMNIQKLATAEMDLFYNTALSHLDSINAPKEKKHVFEVFAKSLMNRDN
ncbi:MAG: polyprenyl synthetase family protein [Flavobacteriales bacterium]|nr:polyprenyl synthetase family protein [Flavobacteriales bacterium]